MTPYRAVLLALFVVGGALTVAVPAGAASVGADASGGVAVSDDPVEDVRPTAANGTANNSTLGADISSFMQSSAAEVGGAVETGMWTAAFNATENQSVQVQLVERRTGELRTELTDLRQRKEALVAEREAGNISEVAYKAKVSRLVGQINALKSAINATSARATQANADVRSLDDLRAETDNLTGPEISSVARNVTGVGIGNGEVGPPDGVGNGNANGAAGEGETGPPADVGNGTVGNGTNASAPGGPPGKSGDAGNDDNPGKSPITGNSSDNETSPPNGSAPGAPGNGSDAGNGTGVGNGTDDGTGNGVGVGIGNGIGLETDSSQVVASVAAVTTPDFFDRVSHVLGARTYAVEYVAAS